MNENFNAKSRISEEMLESIAFAFDDALFGKSTSLQKTIHFVNESTMTLHLDIVPGKPVACQGYLYDAEENLIGKTDVKEALFVGKWDVIDEETGDEYHAVVEGAERELIRKIELPKEYRDMLTLERGERHLQAKKKPREIEM